MIMPTRTGYVATSRAQRYVKQLVSHFGTKVTTELTDSGGILQFDFGRCDLEVTPDGIRLLATCDDPDQLPTVADVVGRHLERFGAADQLTVTWSS
jgi:hypothetical protein